MNIKIETTTLTISHDNLEAAIIQFLHANRLIPLEWDILEMDLGVPVDANGHVEFDLTYAAPEQKTKPNLRVIENEQLTLFNV